MSERSTPDGHDAEGNYDWRNDPLENTPIVRGYQPTKSADVLHDLRQMSGTDHVGQTAIRAAAEIERLRARQRATGKRPGAWCCAGCGYPPDECGCDDPTQETTVADEFYAGLYWVRATPDAGLRVATPKECAAEIIRLRALVTPTPPAQDAPHDAQAQRTGSDEGEAPEGAGGSCGT